MKPDQKRVGSLLIDTVSLLCRNGLNFATDIKVQGLLGITVDDNDIFLVHFNEILSEKQSDENQLVDVETSIKPASTAICPSIQDDESLGVERSVVRGTGFGSSTTLRHRFSNLSHGTQARRRIRRFGQHLRYQQKVNKIDSDHVDTNDDEKPDCSSNYSDIKTDSKEIVLPDVLGEQDDVILVESEDGQAEDISSYVKEEAISEISNQDDKLMYSFANSYQHMNSSTSEIAHGQEAVNLQGAFSNVSYASDYEDADVKPDIQMQSSGEIWALPDADWQSAESNCATGSNYIQRSMYLQPSIPNNYHGSAHVGSRSRQRSIIICPPNAVNQRRDYAPLRHARRKDISSRWTSNTREDFEGGTSNLNNRQASFSTTSLPHRRQMSQMAPSAKIMYKVTKYVCNICDVTFNHHCTLLTHQVRKHGRQKNARRGRPSTYAVPSFGHNNLELE